MQAQRELKVKADVEAPLGGPVRRRRECPAAVIREARPDVEAGEMSVLEITALPAVAAPEGDARRLRSGLVWAAGLGLLALAIALAVPDLRGVLARAGDAEPAWLLAALALELLSCLGYVAVVRLVLHAGPRREVGRLAWAEMAFGAVVPLGGAGGLAVGAWAMRAWGIPWARVANRSAVIFLLTSAVNAAVLAIAGFAILAGLGSERTPVLYGLLPALAGALAIAAFACLPALVRARPRRLAARRGWSTIERLAGWVSDTLAVLTTPDRRLLGALAYLLADIGSLYVCLRAVGASPSLFALIAGYQIGYLANLIPIPGAIGVLEGGLVGALVLYGLPAVPTAAAVLLYHGIALWLPALGGSYGFVALRRSLSGNSPTAIGAVPVPRRLESRA